MRGTDATYAYLVDKFGEDRINNRVEYLKVRICNYLDKTGYCDLYLLNTTVLKDAVTDYFADIARLKEFQGIEHTNKNKITSYMSYWILKRKPIQIVCDECSKYNLTYPNEEFVATLIIKDFLRYNSKLLSGMPEVKRLFQDLLYFLKYRLTTPQSLELFLEGIHTGIKMGIQLHIDDPSITV